MQARLRKHRVEAAWLTLSVGAVRPLGQGQKPKDTSREAGSTGELGPLIFPGSMILMSIITCPHCGHAAMQRMPSNACQIFYECRGCGARLKPKPGDCCVFCSYVSVPCPSVQARQAGMPQ